MRDRARAAGICIAVNEHAIVLGIIRKADLAEAQDDDVVEQIMEPGPSTFRPQVPIQEMADYFAEHDLVSAPITRSNGTLIGVLFRDDAQRAARALAKKQSNG